MLEPVEIPLSLYAHFPWCIRKCPYCDFNSHELTASFDENRYIDQLLFDLEADRALTHDRTIETLFLGGGTPSLFSADAISTLLLGIATRIPIAADVEVTMEINPGSIEQVSRLAAYRDAGVTRLSIGAQSFGTSQLQKLGRIHEPDDTRRVAAAARQAGFAQVNLDLMHGLPGQTIQDAMRDLEDALALAPDHLSWYQLTIEPNTVFYNRPPALPNDEMIDTINEEGARALRDAGFSQYELSAWAIPDHKCRHNVNYWQFGDYIGIGAGAHGKLTDHGRIIRTTRTRLPRDYLRSPNRKAAPVAEDERVLEFMICCLRLHAGFRLEDFQARTGLPGSAINPFLNRAEQRGLIARDQDAIIPTERGMHFHNDLLALID